MKESDLEPILRGIAPLLKAEQDARATLERRVAELEQLVLAEAYGEDFADGFKGAWQPFTYARGALVVRRGRVWYAQEKTSDTPGESAAWVRCKRIKPKPKRASESAS